jgi:hypothetical protein
VTFTNSHGGESVPKPVRSQGAKNKAAGKRNEYRVRDKARERGIPARRIVMSGAVKNAALDGDVDMQALLVEAKERKPRELADGKSISVKLEWWEKIRQEAALSGRPCAVWVHPKGARYDFVIMDHEQFLTLVERAINVSGS